MNKVPADLSLPEVHLEPEIQEIEMGYEPVNLGDLESMVDMEVQEEVDVSQL